MREILGVSIWSLSGFIADNVTNHPLLSEIGHDVIVSIIADTFRAAIWVTVGIYLWDRYKKFVDKPKKEEHGKGS
jgi:hypothetical protein